MLQEIKEHLFDRFGWFRKEFTYEFCDRGCFNYLLDHPEFIDGKVGVSNRFKGMAFWNTTGSEDAVMFPTSYFPLKWIEKAAGMKFPDSVTNATRGVRK